MNDVEEKYKQLLAEFEVLRKRGHAVLLHTVYDAQNKMVSCDMTHYKTCVVCRELDAKTSVSVL